MNSNSSVVQGVELDHPVYWSFIAGPYKEYSDHWFGNHKVLRGGCWATRSHLIHNCILASRIDGNVGILGEDYPGYFDVGDTKQLAQLLTRAETCPKYLFIVQVNWLNWPA
jgi:hypothetical protein